MNFDWLKPISARLEGRAAIICAVLAFCGFCLWLFLTHPTTNEFLSNGLVVVVLLLAITTVLIVLLRTPQPSEPAAKFLFQQVGQQSFFTGGYHSSQELIATLRAAYNIQSLPAPTALVTGSVTETDKYKTLAPPEAAELQRQDEAGIQKLLQAEAERIKSVLIASQVSGGPAEETKKTKKFSWRATHLKWKKAERVS